jgi:predicted RNA-binding Zn ribbon-like protein
MARKREITSRMAAVRFGGHPGPGGYVFEITGGHLCLDLANTLDNRPTAEPRELLLTFRDLVSWGVQAGAISGSIGRSLRREAKHNPQRAKRALGRARRVREEIFRIFSALAAGHALPAPALEGLSAAVSEAFSTRRLTMAGSGVAWKWPESPPFHLDRVLWPALVSAAELLTSDELSRVRECEGERCAWLFIDRSKNRSRRWCDMTVCGNRVKARRHYARTKRLSARSTIS